MSDLNVDNNLKTLLISALEISKGNRKEASELLGISHRTIFYWIEKYELTGQFPMHMNRRKKIRSIYHRKIVTDQEVPFK